jgi:hypothetical protein
VKTRQGFKPVLSLKSDWIMPFIKPSCKVLYNVRTGHLKP